MDRERWPRWRLARWLNRRKRFKWNNREAADALSAVRRHCEFWVGKERTDEILKPYDDDLRE